MSTSKLHFFSFSGTFSAIHVEIFFDHCEQRGEMHQIVSLFLV